MSQLIATINGKQVYSDKPVSSIINTRVNFTDGSWCDVATGEVQNIGHGYICVDTTPTEDADVMTTVGPKSFNASGVYIRDVTGAEIDVQPYDGNEVIVTIEGPADSIKASKVENEGNDVIIEGVKIGGKKNISINSRDSSISIGNIRGGSVVIGGISVIGGKTYSGNVTTTGTEEPKVSITVKVPKHTAVRMEGDWNGARIGNTEGDVVINSTGVGKTYIGNVGNATIHNNGVGEVTLNHVTGYLHVQISSVGSVHVINGTVTDLDVNVTSVGKANLQVSANTGTLKASSIGGINVRHIINRPSIISTSIGKVRVGNW